MSFLWEGTLFAHNFATIDLYAQYEKIRVYKDFSDLYPAYKDTKKFVPDIQSENDFKAKNPYVTIIKGLTDTTRSMGSICWFFEVYKRYHEDPFHKESINQMKIWNDIIPTDDFRPEEKNLHHYDKLLKWFYKANFNEKLMAAKHAVDQYIHKKLFSMVKRSDLKRIDRQCLQISIEQEWDLFQHLMKIASSHMQRGIFDDQGETLKKHDVHHDITGHAEDYVSEKKLQNFVPFLKTLQERKVLLKNILQKERALKETHVFLYRATKPFIKKGIKILDSTLTWDAPITDSPKLSFVPQMIKEAIDKTFWNKGASAIYMSFSYGQSLFAHVFDDAGACPGVYWASPAVLQRLCVPKAKMASWIKKKYFVFRPFFGLTNTFVGGGEWHPRTGLPKDVFNHFVWKAEKTKPNCFNTEGQHPMDMKVSDEFFNTGVNSFKLEVKIIKRIIKYVDFLKDEDQTVAENYTENFKKYLEKILEE